MRLSATRACTALASIALASLAFGHSAAAQVKLRVGKAQAQTFAFVPADVGVEAGIFKKHGLDVEISNFGGDAKLLQALSADAIDIAMGGGPTFAFIVKGAPMLAVGALADAPGTIMLVVAQGRPGEDRGRPQGPHRERLHDGLAHLLARPGAVALARLGQRRHQDRAARLHRPRRRRRSRPRQIDGVITETSTSSGSRRKAAAASWCGSASASRISTSTSSCQQGADRQEPGGGPRLSWRRGTRPSSTCATTRIRRWTSPRGCRKSPRRWRPATMTS